MEVMLFNFMIIDFGLLMFPDTGGFARETPRPVKKPESIKRAKFGYPIRNINKP